MTRTTCMCCAFPLPIERKLMRIGLCPAESGCVYRWGIRARWGIDDTGPTLTNWWTVVV